MGLYSIVTPYFAPKPKGLVKHLHQQQRENESIK